ncbi:MULTISPECIES: RidA family protein [unclassified Rhodococcus (in: high G+C Gram-positive bacteria)]|uniref:RidA family protein n=1 Tax=unclassified Rhodococcus (in: high G+C Gram-positive bacteria) TaxID=192944 RepID=UPI00163974B0|nr:MULTISPECIES: RidA family protein [unclassified Rhodococcus (in: high G+C Gram-positive bacteria)]MBC2641834.1 RidA family protein [Rhodococcus sp. 3A]MBC2893422.1 RidA family protein [Rhodococcus sp. 4CII]
MTDRRELVPHPAGTERPYARAAVFAGVVWACGQIPTTADGQTPTAIGDQVRVALDNLDATLRASGGGLHTLLKLTVYLADLSEFDDYNAAYLARLDGIALPPRTTVEVARFRGGKRIEIDGVAAVDPRIDKRRA